MSRQPVTFDPAALVPSWQLALRADRKSPQTLKSYSDGVRLYLAWCVEQAAEPLDRTSLRGWVSALLDGGNAPATARSRQLAVRRFTAWLLEEGEIPTDPFLGIRAPRLDTGVVQPLTEDQLRALLHACQPPRGATPAEALRYRRDEAMLRLMLETGARAGEVVGLRLADLDLPAGTALIRRGKGGKGRVVPFGPTTARALDRYLRLRARHRLAGTAHLWVGDRGKGFSYDALHKTLKQRADAAGIPGFHPHLMRHTAAHRWLAAGGSEGGLMAVAGWTRPDMLLRYTKAQAASRAAAEARTLNLGEL
ncbi:tyrosine-type recombinase/integrase [Flexivirga lutea]